MDPFFQCQMSSYTSLEVFSLRSILISYSHQQDRDSVVCMVTRYGLDVPRIESQQGRGFPHPSIPYLGPNQPPVKWKQSHFLGSETAGEWL